MFSKISHSMEVVCGCARRSIVVNIYVSRVKDFTIFIANNQINGNNAALNMQLPILYNTITELVLGWVGLGWVWKL